jgi:RNA polymerase sigma-70 factor (ECF subfamily)
MQAGVSYSEMSAPPSDSTHVQPLPAVAGSHLAEDPSDLELEVIALFDGYRSRLLGYVSAFGITGHDGEEVVQEVFLSLFCHLRLGKSRSNLRGWIFRVAHNLALKQRHANQRWRERNEPDAQTEAAHDPDLNPEEQLLSVQRQRRLLSVVNCLPERDRLCFCLRAEGLRYREIANVLGISLGSVSGSLTRSLARLMRADEV